MNAYNYSLPRHEYLEWTRRWIAACVPLLTGDGLLWVMINDQLAGRIQCILEETPGLHYRETIHWNESFGVHCQGKFGQDHRPIFRCTKHRKKQVFHPDRVPSARQLVYKDRRADPRGRIPSNIWSFSRVCGTFRERVAGVPTQLPLSL